MSLKLPVAAAMLIASLPAAAFAEESRSTLSIRAQVQDTCEVEGGTLDFGTYAARQAEEVRVTGAIGYAGCGGLGLTVELDGGNTGDDTDREMRNANGEGLRYGLYRDVSHLDPFGLDTLALTDTPSNNSGSFAVYGVIPANQDMPAGLYTDTLNLILSF